MKVKRIVLGIIFLGSALLGSAQTKYEYMTIVFSTYRYNIGVSIDGKQFQDEELDIPKSEKNDRNTNPLLKKVTLYEGQGWELMNMECVSSTVQGFGIKEYIAYLRKKKA
jgi:hypothetical protein